MRPDVSSERARKIRAHDKRVLRKNLNQLISSIAVVMEPAVCIPIVKQARSVPALLEEFARYFQNRTGTDSDEEITVFGTLSDIARQRTDKSERIDTPADILRWFSRYIQDTLDRKDLRL